MNLETAHREMTVVATETGEFIQGMDGLDRFKCTTMGNTRVQSLVSQEPNKQNLKKEYMGLTTVRSREIMV